MRVEYDPRSTRNRLAPMNWMSAFLRLAAVSAIVSAFPTISVMASEGSGSTIHGSHFCNGACLPDPKPDDHVMVIYAIDGSSEIRAEVEKILEDFYPDKGLDADSAGPSAHTSSSGRRDTRARSSG